MLNQPRKWQISKARIGRAPGVIRQNEMLTEPSSASHTDSIRFMIAGASWSFWIGFHIVVAILLLGEGLIAPHKKDSRRPVWLVPAMLLVISGAFAVWIGFTQGRSPALEFAAGYTIELSLSIDNLFVFLVLLQGFSLSPERQQKALLWGVGGAIILRAIFIIAGVTLLQHFEWVTWIFGLFLLYAAWKLAREHSPEAAIPAWVRKFQTPQSSLLPVILAVELTDLLFAVDSVPAVLSVTRNPFIAYTSNIAAILGLRSLYVAIATMLERVRFLHIALALLLGFVGVKMLASPWFDLPVTISLVIIGVILGGCALANAILPKSSNS
jgi:tellurite resistance protein TerC